MGNVQAIIFDLDDTLVDRNKAVETMFSLILNTCYRDMDYSSSNMLDHFKEYDKRAYGNNDKTTVLESLFDEFPPSYRLPRTDIMEFWNIHFPACFAADQTTIDIVNQIKKHAKVAIITNGSTQRQTEKIKNAALDQCFDCILISEEVGFSKPDKRIYELALTKLNVQPENVLFVGDHLVLDVWGSQQVHMKGIWYNPKRIKNDTDILPYAEIDSYDKLLNYLT